MSPICPSPPRYLPGARLHGAGAGLGTGRKLKLVPDEMAAATGAQIGGERQQSELHFAALKRLLDREEPGWSRLR
jgi:hypothetical protein